MVFVASSSPQESVFVIFCKIKQEDPSLWSSIETSSFMDPFVIEWMCRSICAVQVKASIWPHFQSYGILCGHGRTKLVKTVGCQSTWSFLGCFLVFLLIVTNQYLHNLRMVIIAYITFKTQQWKYGRRTCLVFWDDVSVSLYILDFCVIMVQFSGYARVAACMKWEAEFLFLCSCACFCFRVFGFFGSLSLPHDILVVHLGWAAELLYHAVLWADVQLFVCLPSNFHPSFCLCGVEIDPS